MLRFQALKRSNHWFIHESDALRPWEGKADQTRLFEVDFVSGCLYLGDEELLTKRAGECILPGECPDPCVCNGATVDCSNKKLTSIPKELPIYTSTLWVTLFIPLNYITLFLQSIHPQRLHRNRNPDSNYYYFHLLFKSQFLQID